MHGLTAVVTGGGAGLGATTARLMAERGAAGIGLIDSDGEAAGRVAAELDAQGHVCACAIGDIATGPVAHALFEELVATLGRVHVLVNCAAVYPRRPLLDIDDAAWDRETAVNIKGTYHMMVAAVRHMRAFADPPAITGRIVNISSVDAFKAHPQNAHYAATKAAVVSLTRSFAAECAAQQILVNAVAPAGMATEQARASGFLDELARANPLGRAAEPAEIAEFVIMAASSRNTYMTGETLIVSGGYVYG